MLAAGRSVGSRGPAAYGANDPSTNGVMADVYRAKRQCRSCTCRLSHDCCVQFRQAGAVRPQPGLMTGTAWRWQAGAMGPPLLIVDTANVVGSVPDGWWRDRAAAAERLRDGLRLVAERGLPGTSPPLAAPLEVVIVVEGAAVTVSSVPGVGVVPAPGSGDDTIVDLVRGVATGRVCAVVTADRALQHRVRQLGAVVLRPAVLPHPGRQRGRR